MLGQKYFYDSFIFRIFIYISSAVEMDRQELEGKRRFTLILKLCLSTGSARAANPFYAQIQYTI